MTIDLTGISHRFISLFTRLPIEVVYLYGSAAEGTSDQLSDYDFGILFSKRLGAKRRFDLRLKLFSDIARRLNVSQDDIDVVDLKEVPVLLQFNIISGKTIYCRNQEERIIFETYIMSRYHDEHYYYDRYLKETLEKVEKGVYFDRQIPYT